MSAKRGRLGDQHQLTGRVRAYANEVISGDRWPLAPEHVDLSAVTFETSTRMQRRHGVCVTDGDRACTVRISAKTADRGGWDAVRETIRHELVHVMQHQTEGMRIGHGDSFREWARRLDLSGRCANHYEPRETDFDYRFYCGECGFVGGRYRLCKSVRAAVAGTLRCGGCGSTDLEVRTDEGVLAEGDLR